MKKTRLIKAIETLEAAVNLVEKASACGAGAPGAPGFSPNNTCNRFSGGSSKPAAGGESAGSENQKVRLSSEMIPLEKEKHLKSVAGDLKKAGLSGRMVKKGEKRYLQLSTTGMSGGMIASSVAERLAEKAEWVKDSSSVSPGADSDVAVLSKNGLSIKVSSHGEKPTTIAILKMTETGKEGKVPSKPPAESSAISKPKPKPKPPKPESSKNPLKGKLNAVAVRNELAKKFGIKKSPSLGDSNPYSGTQSLYGLIPVKNRKAMLDFFSDPKNGWVEKSHHLVEGYVGYEKEQVRVTIQKTGEHGNMATISIHGPKKKKPSYLPYYD